MSVLTVEKHWTHDGVIINVGDDGGYVMVENTGERMIQITVFNDGGDVVLEEGIQL
jgi:urease beta subunit